MVRDDVPQGGQSGPDLAGGGVAGTGELVEEQSGGACFEEHGSDRVGYRRAASSGAVRRGAWLLASQEGGGHVVHVDLAGVDGVQDPVEGGFSELRTRHGPWDGSQRCQRNAA
ncbi:hypothetical protein GCM10010302_32370 [Streptomyces polychromogenes]|uniref:Uncharacterized protein n=1 Tax=Streptomyces polychromogenes TaxID=67342 RepID=A0ABP3F185_9ACTN